MADNNEERAQNDLPVALVVADQANEVEGLLARAMVQVHRRVAWNGRFRRRNHPAVAVAEQLMQPPMAVAIGWGDDEEGEDDGLFFAGGALAFPLPHAALRGRREAQNISALLFDMVKVPYTCTSLLSGWSGEDKCSARVQQCQETPEQAFYSCTRTHRNPLHEACLRNACIHVIQALISANRGGNVARDNQGNLPLHLLFISHSPMSRTPQEMEAIVEALLENNADGNATVRNRDGNSALHIACSAEPSYISPAIIRRLLGDNGAACASVQNILHQRPLHMYCKQPSNRTSIEIARILLEAYPQAGHAEDVAGRTPLHHAALKSNTELVCFLVEHAEQAASIRSGPLQETPLHLLCQEKPREQHLPALRALVNAAPETVTMANRQMSSPLHALCKNKQPSLEAIRILITADPGVASMSDSEGYTALHYACEYQAGTDVVECLLAAYREAASVVSRKSDTALHIACSANASDETVQLLIKANPDALTMKNDYGYSPLHCVCRAYTPRVAIVQAIVEACPRSVTMRTNGGESAMHLACSSGAYVGVLRILSDSQTEELGTKNDDERLARNKAMANKIGNTPLHEACFRGSGYERIETLAQSNPGWILARNNAGFTPLQILCKGGRLDERVVTSFARIGGPEVFSVSDDTGHTPLHSACREGTDIAAIQSLIRAYPDALYVKTVYGDTPLHLAVLRKANVDVVRLIAESRLERQSSPLLERNVSSQTPVDIAMEAFQNSCRGGGGCCVVANALGAHQVQTFDVLAMLVKLLFYGCANEDVNLVTACVSLHRQNVRLDPAFIRRAITLFPEQVRVIDAEGNYPLHIEASIPVEKMSLLDSSITGCCNGKCHTRLGVLEMLLEAYPEALKVQNSNNDFPLGLMIRGGRTWSKAFALSLRTFPQALHWYGHVGIDDKLLPSILVNVSKHCGTDVLYHLLSTRPTMVARRPDNNMQ